MPRRVMFSFNRWFINRYMRPTSKTEAVPSDAQILAHLNSRIDTRRYRYREIVDLRGYIVPVLRQTMGADFFTVDLIHVSDKGEVTALDSATVVEDELKEFLPPAVLKRCYSE